MSFKNIWVSETFSDIPLFIINTSSDTFDSEDDFGIRMNQIQDQMKNKLLLWLSIIQNEENVLLCVVH
jgi:hypothetical protein